MVFCDLSQCLQGGYIFLWKARTVLDCSYLAVVLSLDNRGKNYILQVASSGLPVTCTFSVVIAVSLLNIRKQRKAYN